MTSGATYLATLVAGLAETPAELEMMTRALDLLALAGEAVEPSPELRSRILARVGEPQPATFEDSGFYFARGAGMDWSVLAPGVRVKWLFADSATGARTGLIEMAPGLPFPEHPHPDIEDLYLISGDAWVGDIEMHAGDYCRAPAGTAHDDVRSGPAGAVALVVSR